MLRTEFVWLAVLIFVLGTGLEQKVEGKPLQQPSPPDVKKTADAIVGKWSGHMTARVAGAVETFDWSMDCRLVAFGAGAACTNSGKASIGEMAESCLLAYDPEGKAVHYMCVTSMGEVHDHKGQWKDDKTIEFEPLLGGMIGKRITETNRWFFPTAATITKTSIVALPDGSTMSFEFNGKRQ